MKSTQDNNDFYMLYTKYSTYGIRYCDIAIFFVPVKWACLQVSVLSDESRILYNMCFTVRVLSKKKQHHFRDKRTRFIQGISFYMHKNWQEKYLPTNRQKRTQLLRHNMNIRFHYELPVNWMIKKGFVRIHKTCSHI